MTSEMEEIGVFSFLESMEYARFWSRRVSAVKFCFGIVGAEFYAINAFVLAGFPTTQTLTVFFAT
jgi:hypothetical protein